MYLNESPEKASVHEKQLNDLVIQKILTLGKSYKQELKLALDKSPNLKTKFSNAIRISTGQAAGANSNSQSSADQQRSQMNKTPKIQLNFNFSKK